jgi:amino acid adenylation domain-containing protein
LEQKLTDNFQNPTLEASAEVNSAVHDYISNVLNQIQEPVLPFDLEYPVVNGGRIEVEQLFLEELTIQRLRALTDIYAVSPKTLFYVAWSLVIAKCSNKADVVFGSLISECRSDLQAWSETVLPFRINLVGQMIGDLLRTVEHDLENLHRLEKIDKPRTIISFYDESAFSASLSYSQTNGVQLVDERQNNGIDYPFSLLVDENPEGFKLAVRVDSSIKVERIAAYVKTAIGAILDCASQDEQKLALDLSVLPAEEIYQQLIVWNDTYADFPQLRVNEIFEHQVDRTADATAVVCAGKSISYLELNQRANRLAHSLVTHHGIKRNSLVGVCIDRSIELIVSLLGVLKAGGAYVPLDPNYPEARIAYLIGDAGLSTIITTRNVARNCSIQDDIALIIDDSQEVMRIQECPNTNPTIPNASPSDLAYVVYTSGSTGLPKGCLLEHLGLVNLTFAHQKLLSLNSQSNLLQFSSISFDVGTSEWCSALLSGATLVIPTADEIKDIFALESLVQSTRISHVSIPPALIDSLTIENWTAVQHITVSGESCPLNIVKKWAVGRCLYNAYGPSEASVDVSIAKCPETITKLHIGRPIQNKKVYILDERRHLCPIGVAGELYVGGVGLARGYLNRDALTEEKFVSSPFSSDGEMLYRTGDTARYLEDGAIEFIGRKDSQVKIRGFRIELGELEEKLASCVGVAYAVTAVKRNTAGERCLVAYIVRNDAHRDSDERRRAIDDGFLDNLRRTLSQELPSYMIPAFYVMLDHLPLTPNGKIDRASLPEPDFALLLQSKSTPRTEVETTLCEIFEQVLGVTGVGIHDDFFMLGGDSISVLRVVARARSKGIYLSVTDVAANGAIAKFNVHTGKQAEAKRIPDQLIPLTFSQIRYFSPEPIDPKLDIMIEQYPLTGEIDVNLLRECVENLLRMHEGLRYFFVAHMDFWYAKVDQNVPDSFFQFVDLSEMEKLQQNTTVNILVKNIIEGFQFLNGGLVKFLFVKNDDNKYTLLLVAHHVVLDGFSLSLIEQDLMQIYLERSGVIPEAVGFTSDSAAMVSLEHWSYLMGGAFSAEADYWLSLPWENSRLIPFDYDCDANQPYTSEVTKRSEMNSDKTRQLLKVLHEHNLSCYDALVYCISDAVSELSGGPWVQLDTVSAGRSYSDKLDLSQTVGFLAHKGLLFLKKAEEGTELEKCGQIRDQISAMSFSGIGFYLLDWAIKQGLIAVDRAVPSVNRQVTLNFEGFSNYAATELQSEGIVFDVDGLLDIKNPFFEDSFRYWFLDFSCVVLDGALRIDCQYSANQYSSHTIERLTDLVFQRIDSIIDNGKLKTGVLSGAVVEGSF